MKELLLKYKLDEVKQASVPMTLNIKLDLDQSRKSMSEKVYKGIIDSILYSAASKLDIGFIVCMCALFQVPLKNLI